MKSENNAPWGARIERGSIKEVSNGTYTVESYDRPGVTGWGLASTGDIYTAGDTVYFFLFPDGKGLVIGPA